MRKCVVNYAWRQWYPKGQARLIESLKEVGFDGDILALNAENFSCPDHSDIPYAFKSLSILEAKNRGYDLILWTDASFWAIKPLDSVFKFIEQHGCAMQYTAQRLGVWCTDIALEKFGITRELAHQIVMYTAGFTGLSMRCEKSVDFLNRWAAFAKEGICFRGSWKNEGGCVSKDSSVQGHRHDMTVASFLAYQMKMPVQPCFTFWAQKRFFAQFGEDPRYNVDSICFLAAGM